MTVSIIGLGQSAMNWHKISCDLSIGVNDARRWGKDTDWLLVINKSFSETRKKVIIESKPKKFITHLPDWKKHFPEAEIIRMQSYGKYCKKGHVYSSKTSPFVALSLAFNAGAKDVILWGVDLVNHPVVKDKLKNYELRNYEKFCRAIGEQGTKVWLSSNESELSKFLPVWPVWSSAQ